MWNPFKNSDKNNNPYHFDVEVFDRLFQYLYQQSSHVSVLVDGLDEEAEMLRYEFPYSFEDTRENYAFLKRKKFNNYYELLNQVYQKANTILLDPQDSLTNGYQYDLMFFSFSTPPSEEDANYFTSVEHRFYVYFVYENASDKPSAFRVLYNYGIALGVEDLYDATFLPDINQPAPEMEAVIAVLEKVLAALVQETKIDAGSALLAKHPNARVSKEVSLQDIQELLRAVNYNLPEEIKDQASYFYELYKKDRTSIIQALETNERKENKDYEFYDDGFFPLRYQMLHADNTYFSDWKFEPEDIEDVIRTLLKEENWTFDYPKDTYSHDLFPYVQLALAKRELELLNMNSLGDDYNFFIVRKSDIPHILSVSKRMRLGLEQLD